MWYAMLILWQPPQIKECQVITLLSTINGHKLPNFRGKATWPATGYFL